jgi:hypothetical protein
MRYADVNEDVEDTTQHHITPSTIRYADVNEDVEDKSRKLKKCIRQYAI